MVQSSHAVMIHHLNAANHTCPKSANAVILFTKETNLQFLEEEIECKVKENKMAAVNCKGQICTFNVSAP